MLRKVEKKRWFLLLFFSTLLAACQMNEVGSASTPGKASSMSSSELCESVNGSYCGYVASFKTGESHVDIGKTLSELTFTFDKKKVEMQYMFNQTGLVDTIGNVEATDFSLEGDRIEMILNLEHIGDVRIIGTITETDFTGKIYLPWRGQNATMNFITTKEQPSTIGKMDEGCFLFNLRILINAIFLMERHD